MGGRIMSTLKSVIAWRKNRLYWKGVRKSLAWIEPLKGVGFSGKRRWQYKVTLGPILGFISYGVAYDEEDARCACVTIVLDKLTTLIKDNV